MKNLFIKAKTTVKSLITEDYLLLKCFALTLTGVFIILFIASLAKVALKTLQFFNIIQAMRKQHLFALFLCLMLAGCAIIESSEKYSTKSITEAEAKYFKNTYVGETENYFNK